jgi:hypothetical protein
MIYHATNFENLQSILVNGIKPADWSGETYFANNPSYAAGFLQMRGVQQIVVFAVNMVDLDPNLLEEGSDHAAAFFPDDLEVTVYAGEVPPEALPLDEIVYFDLR